MSQATAVKLRRDNADLRTSVKIDPRVRDELEIFKIRHRLRSMEAAAHVVLCRALGLEGLLPKDLDAHQS